jgi:pyrimidine-nucleoside phosphorylase
MRMYDLIYIKKTGGVLTPEQIAFWVQGVTAGTIPDEQSAALLMAICWRGMGTEETLALTLGMRDSGARMDLSSVPGLKVDKHSTGGVGDKTTLILGPIVAACGVPCAMFSGRGLGHTGGTIDKFSAVPGLNVELSSDQFRESLRHTGFANSAQTGDICPADRKLYALRDVTATVESIPLITASIMSKKLAGGADALVLDVKCGSGAFMKDREEARTLARSMVEVGKAHGLRMKALLTRMEEPLGWAIGNTLEVMESVEILQGRYSDSVLARMSFRLAAEMLVLGKAAAHLEEALERVDKVVKDGSALRLLKTFVAFNGGDPKALEDFERLPQAAACTGIRADRGGFIHGMDGRALGILAMDLGAGRKSREDRLDLGAGIRVHRTVGDSLQAGDLLFSIHAKPGLAIDTAAFLATVDVRPEAAGASPWLLEEIS